MYGKQFFRIIIVFLAIMALTLILGSSAWATEHKTLHKFKQTGVGGSAPYGGLILDPAGNLYGTTYWGGTFGQGTVFELTPNGDGSWTESVLDSFNRSDGRNPQSSLIFDAAGNLYGTTHHGGSFTSYCPDGCGTVFKLTPNGDGSWTESVLHSFRITPPSTDGLWPLAGLTFDAAGNLYGTTWYGGSDGKGTVFQLTPNGDGSWTESVLHSFSRQNHDGIRPEGGVTFDATGNLYGTTAQGGKAGTVFQLTPNGDGSWTESVLHSFNGSDGWKPSSSLIFDAAGNLYGTTAGGGASAAGTVFELTPNGDGSWTESVLHSFNGSDGWWSLAGLPLDAAGNLYGTTQLGGASYAGTSNYGYGVVFKLRPRPNGGWRYRVIYSFMDHPGAHPQAGLVLDQAGNLYGTTVGDGTTTFGSVFEITPNTAAQDSE